MNTNKVKRKMILDFFDEKIEYINIKRYIVTNDNYIMWLDDFMKDKVYFTNQTQYHLNENVSIQDLNNMMNLNYFYEIVDSYAKYIGFSPYNNENVNYYLFKYNGVGYKIMCLEKYLFICEKIDIYDYEYFFDYEYIRNYLSYKKYN